MNRNIKPHNDIQCSTGWRHFTAATQALSSSCCKINLSEKREIPRKHSLRGENRSLGFIEAVHHIGIDLVLQCNVAITLQPFCASG